MFYFKQYSNGCLKQGSFKPVKLYISMIAKVILLIYNTSINMNFMSNRHFRCKKLAFQISTKKEFPPLIHRLTISLSGTLNTHKQSEKHMKSLSAAEAGHVYIRHLLCCMHHSKCYTSSEIVQGMSTDYGFLLLFTRCTARVQCRQGVISPLFEGCSINQIK